MVARGGGIGEHAVDCLAPSGCGGCSCTWEAKMISFAGIKRARDAGDEKLHKCSQEYCQPVARDGK